MPYRMRIYDKLIPELFSPFRLLSSSYGINGWARQIATDAWRQPLFFRVDSDIARPSLTPIFCDSTWFDAAPLATNSPTRDLYYPVTGTSIRKFQVARHAGRGPVRRSMPVEPGQSLAPWVDNMACHDGHVERAKLDNLWNYYWHKGWVPPATRPK